MWHFNYRCFYSCFLDDTRPAMPKTSLDFVFLRRKSQSEEATLSSLSCLYILANLPGPWRLLETLCLVVCKEILLIRELPRNSSNFSTLYNFVAESDKVKEMSLTIERKSTAQVAAKIAHLSEHSNC